MTEPGHGKRQSVFVAAFGHEVEIVVSVDSRLGAARISRVCVKDISVLVLVEQADSRSLLAWEFAHVVVVVHAPTREFVFRERHVIVTVEIIRVRGTQLNRQPMRFSNAAIFAHSTVFRKSRGISSSKAN
jgi:hypothetical protein